MRRKVENPLLIIFVDAFPYTHRDYIYSEIPCMSSFAHMTPSFGYSINLKTELLAGLNADEAGFFNEFTYDFKQQNIPVLYKVLGWFCRLHYGIDSIAHKIYFRLFKKNIFKIPFEYLSLFKKNGTEAYARDYPIPTFLTEFDFERVLYSDFPGYFRDKGVSEKLEAIIDDSEGSSIPLIFAAFCEVDHKTHELGVGNSEHDSMIGEFVDRIKNPIETFTSKFPEGRVLIFSDHGMSAPTESIRINIESVVGPASPKTYAYFIDATVVRVWIFKPELEAIIREYFDSLHSSVIILTDEDRASYNITNPDFGDLIITVEDSAQFAPNFFGRKGAAGMHGYLPCFSSQQGIVAANFDLSKNDFSPKSFYEFAWSLADSSSGKGDSGDQL